MVYVSLFAGLCLLLLCGDLCVRGAVAAARQLKVSPLVIGLTLVGFGTSLPELVASIEAARLGAPGIAVGNVIGSNIANILLILGLTAIISPLVIAPGSLRSDGPVLLVVSILTFAVCHSEQLGRWWGLMFLIFLFSYTFHTYRRERGLPDTRAPRHDAEVQAPLGRFSALPAALGLTLGGLAGIVVGANLLVDSAIVLARQFGISEAVIGLTVVAVGTSLPELATSMAAALRRHSDVALGNIVGSNIFNLLGILGATAVYRPLPIDSDILRFDMPVMLGATTLLVALPLLGSRIER